MLVPWVLGSVAVALLLLAATWVIATVSTPDATGTGFPGVTSEVTIADYGFVLFRNSLVLALHALACVAGFIAGSSLPQIADGYSGIVRRLHQLARPLAIGFVIAATLFSLATQAIILGQDTATMAHQFGLPPAQLLGILSPRDPRADRAVPAARGVDDGVPPQAVGGPPGGDVRDAHGLDPVGPGRRGDRGLGHPARTALGPPVASPAARGASLYFLKRVPIRASRGALTHEHGRHQRSHRHQLPG